QVLGPSEVLIGMSHRDAARYDYSTRAILKCPTAGMVDGMLWRTDDWVQKTGSGDRARTRHKNYRDKARGTSTVFVLEKDQPRRPGQRLNGEAAKTTIAKAKVAAPDPIKKWEKDVADAKETLRKNKILAYETTDAFKKAQYNRLVKKYELRL